MKWHTSDCDGGISYASVTLNRNGREETLAIRDVVFKRWNDAAKVTEMVHVHWQNAFKWSDADPCGGLDVAAIIWTDGNWTFASGLYFGQGHKDEYSRQMSGLSAVVVGCNGSVMLKRHRRPRRDKHGFPVCDLLEKNS